MKKLLGIVVMCLIVLSNIAEAKSWRSYKKNQIVEKEIVWNSKWTQPLPPGEWKIIESWGVSIVRAIRLRTIALVQVVDDKIIVYGGKKDSQEIGWSKNMPDKKELKFLIELLV